MELSGVGVGVITFGFDSDITYIITKKSKAYSAFPSFSMVFKHDRQIKSSQT